MTSTSSPLIAPRAAAGGIPVLPGLPLLGNLLAFRRDRLGVFDATSRLGPIAKLMLGHLPVHIVTCSDLAHELLVDQAARFHKSAGLRLLVPLLGHGLLTAEDEPHRSHRKLLAPAFAPRRLTSYGEIMVEETRTQLAGWTAGRRIDLADEMMEMTLAIAGRTLFGVDVRRDARTVARGIELAMYSTKESLSSPIQLGYRWPLPRHLRMRRAVKLLDDVVYRLIAEGRARGTSRREPSAGGGDPDGYGGGAGVVPRGIDRREPSAGHGDPDGYGGGAGGLPRGIDRGDVLSMLVLARDEDDGSALTDLQIRDEVMTLLLAGHETTANTLTWTWYELGRNPEVHAQLEAEVQRVLGSRPVTTDDLTALPWTAAVIDEAMRLHPPAYIIGREAMQDVELAGHRLPKRATVLIYVRGIHRRADYFPSPLAFQPERMLGNIKKTRPRHHYLPFGAGPRVCIGAHFALMEAQLALATMVQHARVRPLKLRVEAEPLVTLRPRGGMPAIVERC